MSDLQHERLTALAQELRLPALPNLHGAVAQNFARRQDASFADFLEAILRAERDARRVRARDMLTRTAGFPVLKTLEDFDFAFATGAHANRSRSWLRLALWSGHRMLCCWVQAVPGRRIWPSPLDCWRRPGAGRSALPRRPIW